MASVEDIGIDLGSSNVLICERGKGIVLNEPAVLAVNHDTRNIISIGQEAYQMMGREPAGISVVRPLRRGTIQDFDMLSILLNYFVMRVVGKHLFNRPRALLSVSATANEIEKRQLILGMLEAGARRTQLLERPLAAAMGAGILINEVSGRMVADIGGATTDIAVISSGEIMARSIQESAGDQVTDAIIRYIRLKHNLLIGWRTAEDVKSAIGSVDPEDQNDLSLPVAGRNLVSGLPRQVDVTSEEIVEAVEEPLRLLVEGFHSVIERIPAELANDVFDDGIVLTGGGANLRGLSTVLQREMQIPVYVAEHPQECIALGCGLALERPGEYQRILGDARKRR
ncbi:MAG: rod shape-determining protein [Eubacteriales bacterium]|jgi:rod shape-determining protein MreB|nr:rod shape-determining protein [Eubacteriales bacterium]MDD3109676.1 rod shape-determining protein [Eubacteriales bacterium]MDD3571865.1 rod shape-determining protein [Eubacteriales bacterium]MDD4134796.1 rod shape-determining protein [Eubacteriales bacterium]NLO12820.1 rod shape-determining protein [Clostridiales bacterium]